MTNENVGVESNSMAEFETMSRLVAAMVNEGLAIATVTQRSMKNNLGLQIRSSGDSSHQDESISIWVGLDANMPYDTKRMCLRQILHPDDLAPPIYFWNEASAAPELERNVQPGTLFTTVCQWLGSSEETQRAMIKELNSSVANQRIWLRNTADSLPTLDSRAIDWERAVIRGHPTHPMHRTCLSQDPLAEIAADELLDILNPEIVFISVMRSDTRTVGPFEQSIRQLLLEQDVELAESTSDRIVLPCLARQLPAIRHHLSSNVLQLSSKPLFAKAQASMRTVSLPQGYNFHYDLKLALACNITSALRTITPWTALVGPEISAMLEKLLPHDMWICKEHAAVTGSQKNFDDAKHCSVLVRENLQGKADALGEALIITAALAERSVTGEECHAQRLFELSLSEKKKLWFRRYVALLLVLTLPPALNHGIGLEAHCQNVLARFDKTTGTLTGFAIRDFGGLKLHMPTLRSQGFDLSSSPPGSLITTDDLHEVWMNVHHTIFQSHLNQIIHGLKLQRQGGWAIVRDELYKTLNPDDSGKARAFYDFLTADKVPMKCFLRMKKQGLYRDYIHRDVPNVLLSS